MREIVFDTETTGVFPITKKPDLRDRIVEIGCVELIDLERTGREFHVYLNPERSVPEEVVRVHGLTREFLDKHEKFSVIADEILDFIGDAPLVAHNAAFDQDFINAELRRCGRRHHRRRTLRRHLVDRPQEVSRRFMLARRPGAALSAGSLRL